MNAQSTEEFAALLRKYRFSTVKTYLLLIAYAVILLLPLGLAYSQMPKTDHTFLSELGKSFALMGFALIVMQFVIASRLKCVERPVGIDLLFSFHKGMGVVGGLMILCHPFLLAAGEGEWSLIFSLQLPWYIWLGKTALLLLVVVVLVSVFQKRLLGFEKWRLFHNILVVAILGLVFVHSSTVGGDLYNATMRTTWIVLLVAAASLYVWHRFLKPLYLRKHAYTVFEVSAISEDVCQVKMSPPEGEKRVPFLPGQAAFWTPRRGRDLPVEEHPFTISSEPTEGAYVSATIKNSGDFTATIPDTREGDKVLVDAPYGRFSYLLQPENKKMVMIAGGIGVTPIRSMIQHMRKTHVDFDIIFLYFARTRKDLIFDDEFRMMSDADRPQLRYVPILSDPAEGWSGETGLVDREKLERLCGENMAGRDYYVCGPPPMMNAAMKALTEAGVPRNKIHFEYFSL